MKVLVTGANGFLGSEIVNDLLKYHGCSVVAAIRQNRSIRNKDAIVIKVGDINSSTNWRPFLEDVDVVVHTAGITSDEVSHEYEIVETNVGGTLNLARQASAAGVKRFVFISSIKVNGENTSSGKPFRHSDKPLPTDQYGLSKMQAEEGLRELSRQTNLEVSILRPPLIYGPGVKGNFASLMKLAKLNLPIPLGAIENQRSMVSLANLVSLIVVCIFDTSAANQTFLVKDDRDLSTTELMNLMIKAAGNKPRLLPIPMRWLAFGAKVLGKKAIADRLFGSLQVDISHTKETLGWLPPVTVEEGIQRCFQHGD